MSCSATARPPCWPPGWRRCWPPGRGRQAGPGEFTRRAFLNGKLDLTQAEAVVDLIDAETADAAANAAGQLGGALKRAIGPVYDGLTDLCSHFHAVLDYPDEDIEDFGAAELSGALDRAGAALQELLATYEKGRHLRQGVRAVLLGKPNAGKSSLLNRLAGYDRVIVTDIAGTTRDTVEEPVRVGRVLLRLTDTAGIREAGDAIEAPAWPAGAGRARSGAGPVRLRRLAAPDGRGPPRHRSGQMRPAQSGPVQQIRPARRRLAGRAAVRHRSDRLSPHGRRADALPALLEGWFLGENACDGSLLTNPRQFGALDRASRAIERAKTGLSLGVTPDAVLTDVEEAMAALGEVTGRTVREDITNRIFERFCVGK